MTKICRRRGPKPRDPSRLRTHCVSVRLSPEELVWLDRARKRAGMRRGEYLRHAAMGRPMPKVIPAVNRETWMGLGRLVEDFHRLVSAISSGKVPATERDVLAKTLQDLRGQVVRLRIELLGQL